MKKYRNEWKYVCDESALRMLEERLRSVLLPDPHAGAGGSYAVHSLYFDDLQGSCASEKEAGIGRRVKYRIRYYDRKSDSLFLERKEKLFGRCNKQSCRLSPEEYEALISGNAEEILWQSEEPLLGRFCSSCLAGGLRPRAIIDYERTAFVEAIGNVRITIDRNISASSDFDGFLGPVAGIPLQDAGFHVLEVKFDEVLPGYIRRLVSGPMLRQVSWSKYYYGWLYLQKARAY